jgi:putative flippase GtrA
LTFIRYGMIQVIAYALDMGTFVLLMTVVEDYPMPANVIAKLIAGLFAFFAHRHFTFQSTAGSSKTQSLRYFTLLGLNIPIASLLLTAGLYIIDSPVAVKCVSDVACVLITYWISKRFVFKAQAKSAPLSEGSKGI